MKEGRGPRIARIGSFQRDATLLLPLISEFDKLARRKGGVKFRRGIFSVGVSIDSVINRTGSHAYLPGTKPWRGSKYKSIPIFLPIVPLDLLSRNASKRNDSMFERGRMTLKFDVYPR